MPVALGNSLSWQRLRASASEETLATWPCSLPLLRLPGEQTGTAAGGHLCSSLWLAGSHLQSLKENWISSHKMHSLTSYTFPPPKLSVAAFSIAAASCHQNYYKYCCYFWRRQGPQCMISTCTKLVGRWGMVLEQASYQWCRRYTQRPSTRRRVIVSNKQAKS